MGSPTENFVYQFKGMCYFTNGTERVRLVARQIYNKEEILHFDSDLGKFVAVTELGQGCAETWNTQKDLLAEFRAYVETTTRRRPASLSSGEVGLGWAEMPSHGASWGSMQESDLLWFPSILGGPGGVSISKGKKCWKIWQGRVGRVGKSLGASLVALAVKNLPMQEM